MLQNTNYTNQQKGRIGEAEAVRFLVMNDFILLELNWRWRRCEIDIIAARNGILHIVEVKSRWVAQFKDPEEELDAKKIHQLKLAATEYVEQHPCWEQIQYNLVAIEFGEQVAIRWIEDLY